MKLIINEFGAYLSKKENRFIIKMKDKVDEYSADDVDQILISSPSSLSESAVKLAIEKNIDIVFTSYHGKPFARIYPCTLGGTTLTRREQAKSYFDERGMYLVRKLLEGKMKNQLFLIKRLSKTRDNVFEKEILALEKNLNGFKKLQCKGIEESRNTLLGYEGYASSVYFSCFNKIAPFQKRNPSSEDIFNIALNYGYGILYSEIERACVLSGLDPYLGFLHVDRYGKPSMVLDMVEQFRPLIDRAIINLFVRKQISHDDLKKIGEAVLLTQTGRKKIIEEVMKVLSFKTPYKNKRISLSHVILEQGRDIVRFLLGDCETYEPFLWGG